MVGALNCLTLCCIFDCCVVTTGVLHLLSQSGMELVGPLDFFGPFCRSFLQISLDPYAPSTKGLDNLFHNIKLW